MKKFFKFTGLMLLAMVLILIIEKTPAHAYTYENWKDYVVNDSKTDQWENHYNIPGEEKTGNETSRYTANDLNDINEGNRNVMPEYNLLTKDKRTVQLVSYNMKNVTWKSYDERVCTVSDTGLVTMGDYSGATFVAAISGDGKEERVLVYVSTGKGPEWYDELFVNAYSGCRKEHLLDREPEEASVFLEAYVDNYGKDFMSVFGAVAKLCAYTAENCVELVGNHNLYLAPFFNIPGERGVACGVNAYTGHTSSIAYLDGVLYWLDTDHLEPINKWGYKNGYVTSKTYTTGFTLKSADEKDRLSESGKVRYPEERDLYFYN